MYKVEMFVNITVPDWKVVAFLIYYSNTSPMPEITFIPGNHKNDSDEEIFLPLELMEMH